MLEVGNRIEENIEAIIEDIEVMIEDFNQGTTIRTLIQILITTKIYQVYAGDVRCRTTLSDFVGQHTMKIAICLTGIRL